MSALFLTAFTHELAIGYVSGSRLWSTRLASDNAKATLPFSDDHSFLNSRRYSSSKRASCSFSSKPISSSDRSRSFA